MVHVGPRAAVLPERRHNGEKHEEPWRRDDESRLEGTAEPRWRCTASQDNDVRHEDHRYQRGLANRTKDIQLMIPYVTRGVFTLHRRPPPSLPWSRSPLS